MFSYLRQKFANDISGSYIGMFYWFSFLAFLFYYYFPFKLVGITVVVAITWVAIMILMQERHKIISVYYLNITLASLALYYDWHWGFSLWGLHLESYYCWTILVPSILSSLARQVTLYQQRGKNNATKNG